MQRCDYNPIQATHTEENRKQCVRETSTGGTASWKLLGAQRGPWPLRDGQRKDTGKKANTIVEHPQTVIKGAIVCWMDDVNVDNPVELQHRRDWNQF